MASSLKKQKLSQRKLSGLLLILLLIKNFHASCVHAMSAVLTKGRQMLGAIVMVQTTSSTKKHWRIQSR